MFYNYMSDKQFVSISGQNFILFVSGSGHSGNKLFSPVVTAIVTDSVVSTERGFNDV